MKARQNHRLEIRRIIKAPPQRVYEAWTDPAELRQWLGHESVKTLTLTADARVGGEFRWRLVKRDGKETTIRGEYRELQPGRRIVFTWQRSDEDWENVTSLVTIELSEREGGTEVRLVHEQLPTKQWRDDHARGWQSLLERLERFCAS